MAPSCQTFVVACHIIILYTKKIMVFDSDDITVFDVRGTTIKTTLNTLERFQNSKLYLLARKHIFKVERYEFLAAHENKRDVSPGGVSRRLTFQMPPRAQSREISPPSV